MFMIAAYRYYSSESVIKRQRRSLVTDETRTQDTQQTETVASTLSRTTTKTASTETFGYLPVVMSKTEGQTFRYRFGNETKTFWYRSRICLVENRLFRFGPESALLDQIEMVSFDGADSATNSNILVSFLLDVGTFVKRL
jgi:hypothetical protein